MRGILQDVVIYCNGDYLFILVAVRDTGPYGATETKVRQELIGYYGGY